MPAVAGPSDTSNNADDPTSAIAVPRTDLLVMAEAPFARLLNSNIGRFQQAAGSGDSRQGSLQQLHYIERYGVGTEQIEKQR
jgi:hypothetical protein